MPADRQHIPEDVKASLRRNRRLPALWYVGPLEGRETGQERPRGRVPNDALNPAHGIIVGMAIGLTFWACVLILCLVIA